MNRSHHKTITIPINFMNTQNKIYNKLVFLDLAFQMIIESKTNVYQRTISFKVADRDLNFDV
jgi:hypothetical protein